MAKLLLRWCLGIQDTTRLDSFKDESGLLDMIWLAKLSIASFQRWFPDARFMLFYNGDNIDLLREAFDHIELPLSQELEFIDQITLFKQGVLKNPYHYMPQGVWWKWVPFRYDLDYDEVSIDTDIVCIGEPKDWQQWLGGAEEIIVAPERFPEIVVNTCGDFHTHPVLKGKKPLNCGIVGHRAGFDFSERFFDVTKEIRYGYTHDSLFITEQGAINIWVYSLEMEGVQPYVLDFEKCAWVRDFIYYLEKGVQVETVHATTWHKKIVKGLQSIFERRVLEDYPDEEFLFDLIQAAKDQDFYSKYVVRRQLGEDRKQVEFYF
jgi:hypothetical protein